MSYHTLEVCSTTTASTSTWIFLNSVFLLGNHFLNQFSFCILLAIIKQTYRQKGILITIIPVTFEFYYLQMSKLAYLGGLMGKEKIWISNICSTYIAQCQNNKF